MGEILNEMVRLSKHGGGPVLDGAVGDGDCQMRLADPGRPTQDQVSPLADQFRAEVRAEIRRRLVADRGHEAVAKTLRRPLVEDIDLLHAGRAELAAVERAVHPLTRKLAVRLARRRKRDRHGRLDIRSTIRRSLSAGGVLMEPRFRSAVPSKPELFILSDVSGSVATFARFTLQLVFALSHEFSRVRSFAFIDAIDEVTEFFGPGTDFAEALRRVPRDPGLRNITPSAYTDGPSRAT